MKFFEAGHKYIEKSRTKTNRTHRFIKLPNLKNSKKSREKLKDIPYYSATSFISSFKQPVDWDQKAIDYSQKHNIPLKKVKEKWQKAKDFALQRGTAHHKKREQETIKKYTNHPTKNLYIPQTYTDKKGNEIKDDNKLILQPNTVYPEKMIWLDDYKLCGTADLLETTKDKTINISDYKTSKELFFRSWGGRTGHKPTYLLTPLSDLEECNVTIYNLQLSLYMAMFLIHNPSYKPGDLIIKHEIFNQKTGKYSHTEDHYLPFLSQEIKRLLKYREAQIKHKILSSKK